MIGLRVGLAASTRDGVDVGLDTNTTGGGSAIAGVTRDGKSLKYTPATALEWSTFLMTIGSALAAPNHLWLCQESGSPVLDTIGSGALGVRDLTASANPGAPAFLKSITGWARFAIGGAGAAAHATLSCALVNTAQNSFLVFGYIRSAVSTTVRNVLSYGSPTMAQPPSPSIRLRLGTGIVDSIAVHANDVHPYLFAFNRGASTMQLYTDIEKLSVPYRNSGGQSFTATCASTGDTTGSDFLYLAAWDSVASQTTDAEAKKLIQGLGYTPPWT